MKKLLSVLLAAMLIVACFGMVGCGAEGKYKFHSLEINGEKVEVGAQYEMLKDEGFELAKDGVVKDGDGNVMEGFSWEKDGSEIIIKNEFSSQTYQKKGNKLIIEMTYAGITMTVTYKKA